MGQKISMKKWQNGGGIDLTIEPQHGGTMNRIGLDFADVDVLLGLLQDYKAHPSPYGPLHSGPLRRD